MKFVRFKTDAISSKYGILKDDKIYGLSVGPLEKGWQDETDALDGTVYDLKEVALLTPCTPEKYIGIGLNHVSMINNTTIKAPAKLITFTKPTTSVIPTNEKISLSNNSDEVLFEGELLVVMGKEAKNVKREDALDYVFGYSCTNDITDMVRLREDGGNSTLAKGYDGFGPIGPCIETDIDPDNAHIRTWHNGKLVQDDTTAGLIFKVRELIEILSNVMTLLPGDVIATGTPVGNGIVRPGDTITIEVEGIGTLSNSFV